MIKGPTATPGDQALDLQLPAPQPPLVGAAADRTEHALREFHIRDPALLLRAAVIDQAARDLVSEAKARVDSRGTVTIRACQPTAVGRQIPGLPARTARQDAPRTPQPMQHTDQRRAATAAPASRPELRSSRGAPTAR